MALLLRTVSRRSTRLFNPQISIPLSQNGVSVRNASAMAVPTTSHLENLSHDAKVRNKILFDSDVLLMITQKEASLPNHDPPSDSQTAALVSDHMPYMVATYVRPPPMMVKGEGCYLWDIENRRYLDFTAGIAVNSLGHSDPEIAKLMGQQVSNTISCLQTTRIHHQQPTFLVI